MGATTLSEMLDAGIPMAREYQPPFWDEPDSGKYLALALSAKWRNLEIIDETAVELAGTPLSNLVGKYQSAHSHEI